MFELHVRCPTTGEPVYAGFQSNPTGAAISRSSMANSICPACGSRHAWEAAAVWSAIPVSLSPEAAPFEPSASSSYESPAVQPLREVVLPKVA